MHSLNTTSNRDEWMERCFHRDSTGRSEDFPNYFVSNKINESPSYPEKYNILTELRTKTKNEYPHKHQKRIRLALVPIYRSKK